MLPHELKIERIRLGLPQYPRCRPGGHHAKRTLRPGESPPTDDVGTGARGARGVVRARSPQGARSDGAG